MSEQERNPVNPATFTVLPSTGLTHREFPNFKDALPHADDNTTQTLQVLVLAQVGGELGMEFKDELKVIRANPMFVEEEVHTEDASHVIFTFNIPDEWKEDIGKVLTGRPNEMSQEYVELLVKANPELEDKLRNTVASMLNVEDATEEVEGNKL